MAQAPGPLVFDTLHKQVLARFGQTNAAVSFTLTNISTSPIVICDVSLSCGCSVANMPTKPWTLKPGNMIR